MPSESKPTKVSIVLKAVVKAPGLTQDAQDVIWGALLTPGPDEPFTPHRSCPCRRCHEYYGTLS